jgi:hypothetical protein
MKQSVPGVQSIGWDSSSAKAGVALQFFDEAALARPRRTFDKGNPQRASLQQELQRLFDLHAQSD